MRFRSLAGLCLLLLHPLAGAAPDAPAGVATPETLKLPDRVVTGALDLPRPESWRYVQVDRFEVLSSAGDKETRVLLRSLHDLELALEVVWPALHRRDDRPYTLIICKGACPVCRAAVRVRQDGAVKAGPGRFCGVENTKAAHP